MVNDSPCMTNKPKINTLVARFKPAKSREDACNKCSTTSGCKGIVVTNRQAGPYPKGQFLYDTGEQVTGGNPKTYWDEISLDPA